MHSPQVALEKLFVHVPGVSMELPLFAIVNEKAEHAGFTATSFLEAKPDIPCTITRREIAGQETPGMKGNLPQLTTHERLQGRMRWRAGILLAFACIESLEVTIIVCLLLTGFQCKQVTVSVIPADV